MFCSTLSHGNSRDPGTQYRAQGRWYNAFAADSDVTVELVLETRDQAQQRDLPQPLRADNGHELAAFHRQIVRSRTGEVRSSPANRLLT